MFSLAGGATLHAQGLPSAKVAPIPAGCVDSKVLPKLLTCRIDNCEKKDSDHRDIAVEEGKGEPVTTAIDGNSRSVMYECAEGTTPASIVEQAATALKAAGFEIPYRFADAEASLTAHKDDLWVTVDAASRFYTLTEIKAAAEDPGSVMDAVSIADLMEKYGHVPVFGIQFLPGRADLTPDSDEILDEVVTLMNDHPTWFLRIEGHSDNTGSKMGNMSLSFKRASTVATWLVNKGIKRNRLDPQGVGDAHPIADNTTDEGRAKNRRIELVKIPNPTP